MEFAPSESEIRSMDELTSDEVYHLAEAAAEIEKKYDAVQYQKESVEKSKQDDSYPPEGQYPGYDNKIRISPPKTADKILIAIGEMNEYYYWADQKVKDRKKELVIRLENISNQLTKLNSKSGVLEEKEDVLEELGKLLDKTVQLFKLRAEKKR